jgi:hypothetical protein
MTDPKNMTTIPITKDTRAKLQAIMKYGETYDGIIRKLLECYKETFPTDIKG